LAERNLSFTSINLPRLAIKSNGNLDIFFEDLDRKITLVIDQLMERYKIQAAKKEKNYPFLMGQGIWMDSDKLGPNDKMERY
jgi:ribonucleoside-triphosphate reductase